MIEETLIAIYNLAGTCHEEGDLDRAVELFERCLKADEEEGNEEYARGTARRLGQVLKEGRTRFAAKLEALKQTYPDAQR